jgi:thioredoxin-related protein
MIRTVLITALLFVFSVSLTAQEAEADTTLPKAAVQWLTLEEAETLHRDTPKNFLFLVYNEDCHWCQKMLQETFTDSSVVEKVNTRFYPVKFTMAKAGQFFISSMLLNIFNVQNYPAIFFFSDNFQPVTNASGFLPAEQFNTYLTYAGDTKYFQNMKFEEFKKTWDHIQSLKNHRKE